MKTTEKTGTRNMGTDGRTRPTSTQGIATPKSSKEDETKARIQRGTGNHSGGSKKAGEGVIQDIMLTLGAIVVCS